MFNLSKKLILLAILASNVDMLWAANGTPVVLGSGEYFETSDASQFFGCGRIADKWFSGKLVSPSKMTFLSYRAQIRARRLKLQSAPTPTQSKIQTQIKKLTSLAKKGDKACNQAALKLNPGSSPTVTPTSSPTPGATPAKTPQKTPTPAPTAAAGNFDSAGNVTAIGKAAFGIPSNLSANLNSGKTFAQNNGCLGSCHSEKTNRSFPVFKATLGAAPMFFKFPDSDVANLTAYANRFKLN